MGDIIKFNKPKPVKPQRQPSPALKKAAVIGAIIVGFVAAWAYFQFVGA
ncbi:hypothetical protein ACFSE1_02665 [Rhizobium helianthi]|uniref:HlyD family secretion protein n=1 Tax=Rhizobium helianthi TaxID=1132695 RepID=A0ABW4LZ84_9HYPH